MLQTIDDLKSREDVHDKTWQRRRRLELSELISAGITVEAKSTIPPLPLLTNKNLPAALFCWAWVPSCIDAWKVTR